MGGGLHLVFQNRVHVLVLRRIDRQQRVQVHLTEPAFALRVDDRLAFAALRVAYQRLDDLVARRVGPLLHGQRQVRRQYRGRGRRAAVAHAVIAFGDVIDGLEHVRPVRQHRHVAVHDVRGGSQCAGLVHAVHHHHAGEGLHAARVAGQIIQAGGGVVRARSDHDDSVPQRIHIPGIIRIVKTAALGPVDDAGSPIHGRPDIGAIVARRIAQLLRVAQRRRRGGARPHGRDVQYPGLGRRAQHPRLVQGVIASVPHDP